VLAMVKTKLCEFGCVVKVFWIACGLKKVDEGVAVARHAVTETVTFFEKPSLPDDLGTIFGDFHVGVSMIRKCKSGFEKEMNGPRRAVAPVYQTVGLVTE